MNTVRTSNARDSLLQRQLAFNLGEPLQQNLPICYFHTDLCCLGGGCTDSFISLKSVRIGVVYNWHNEFGMTFSPCCKWVLIESEGGGLGGGVLEEGLGRLGKLGWELRWLGANGGIGWKSQRWKWQCSERGAWLHWDSMRGGAACTAQSEPHKEKVLLSTSNGPLDNHTGTKLLYLTLIAKTAAPHPPTSEPHDSSTFPYHLPA